MFTKDGIRNLANIVTIDPIRTCLLPQFCATQGFATFDIVQVKERSYHNQHPIDQFLPFTIEVFCCLHKHVDVFLHDYANAIWSLKGIKGWHFSTLVIFLHQKVSITLQRMQTSSILNWVIVVGLAIPQLPPLQNTPPITMAGLLQAVDF